MKLTVRNIKEDKILLRALGGLCEDDDEVLQYLNRAEQLMLNQGRFWGSVKMARFCLTSGCRIVMPWNVDVVERIAVCGQPAEMVTEWFQFTQNLARVEPCAGCSRGGCSSSGSCSPQAAVPLGGGGCGHLMVAQQGTAVSFDTTRAGETIRTYLSNIADVGKKVIYQGYDSDGNWVRTEIDGSPQDGEQVTLVNQSVDTVTEWAVGSPTAVIKEETDYLIRVYGYNPTTTSERFLARYQPAETNPEYRVLQVPDFQWRKCGTSCCDTDEDPCNPVRTVDAMVSLAHTPLAGDNDWLIFENLQAYQSAMMAVKYWEQNNVELGNFHFYGYQAASRNARGATRVDNRAGAIPLLTAELRKKGGDLTNTYVHIDKTNTLPRALAGFI